MTRKTFAVLGLLGLATASAVAVTSCTQSAVNIPVRTFERAQRVDVVCLHVKTPDQIPIPAEPAPQAQCAPVPANVDGSTLPYHLYALVTQTARGEVAVVDLTAGAVVDGDHSTPGINFIPVGALPTDVAVAPDGKIAFIGAAEVNKPALYAIATKNILGDSQGLPADVTPAPPTLPSLPVCTLPQAPSSVVVVPHGDTYEIAVVLPGDARGSAKVITLDPMPFLRGAGLDPSDGNKYPPGQLAPCVATGSVELEGTVPSATPGATWDDGVNYADAATPPPTAVGCTSPVGDAGADSGAGSDSGSDSGSEAGAPSSVGLRPHASSAARDGTTLYVGDDGVPVVHVLDLSTAGKPKEVAPLLATSQLEPARRVAVGDIAVSPATSEYKKYLYALDKKEGSILVYDVSNLGEPNASPHVPLTRPHPELNPFQPPDRIVFNAPVAAVSFVRHDFPLTHSCGGDALPLPAAKSGLLCNPNPNAGPAQGPPASSSDEAFGMCYRANATTQDLGISLGPMRLRGVFGFATLSNGQVVAIDVDDWDAPCRRPDPMCEGPECPPGAGAPNAIAPAEPAVNGPTDLNPYHAPLAFQGTATTPVSLEFFFPVSAPHRPRSLYMLTSNPSVGVHAPVLNGVPQLFSLNNALPTSGASATENPILLPTATNLVDPSYEKNPGEPDPFNRVFSAKPTDPALSLPNNGSPPAVRFAWEDPQVHLDQDWTVTFEGTLPGFDGTSLATPVVTNDGYRTLTLSNSSALFCRKGIEDARVGTTRAAAVTAEMLKQSIVPPVDYARKVADYVQIADEILDVSDPYWSEAGNDCWDDLETATPQARHDACATEYGAAADQNTNRDFPILEAYDDHVVLGRFGYTPNPDGTLSTSRVVVGSDAGNVRALKRMRCCFHHQVQFKVRTGGTWVAVGSAVGYLHRMTTDDSGACVLSCEPREALLNGRAPPVPWPSNLTSAVPPGRDSALAMRNPAFAFVVWDGQKDGKDVFPVRDLQWRFTTRGQFVPLVVNIASTTTAVSPQSMRFIDSLGQLALVDGASQGLVLIDLNTVTLAHTPFF